MNEFIKGKPLKNSYIRQEGLYQWGCVEEITTTDGNITTKNEFNEDRLVFNYFKDKNQLKSYPLKLLKAGLSAYIPQNLIHLV